eukprot:CAMPEP_0206495822 /NCGR_PEP_ID=MMETSP0324_2-20121206/48896_1 /ASSEMBLY_ACC=CAM_ASM_000836 /TAXON_ID=2866 /ORGANISM="Crypthecodinium cohnii, Strain Seligo" /LENGTH=141 /DNA_ID=CAMNT_0053980429 /DNA_START=723 /DNA_END=1145 /DNA_ORIENTATION=+
MCAGGFESVAGRQREFAPRAAERLDGGQIFGVAEIALPWAHTSFANFVRACAPVVAYHRSLRPKGIEVAGLVCPSVVDRDYLLLLDGFPGGRAAEAAATVEAAERGAAEEEYEASFNQKHRREAQTSAKQSKERKKRKPKL